MQIVERTTDLVKVKVITTTPASAQVFVFDAAGETLKADLMNLASEKARVAFCASLTGGYGLMVEPLLLEILIELATSAVGEKLGASIAQGEAPQPITPEPWSDPVDGVALLNEIRAIVHQFVVLPPAAGIAIALWIVHTYVLGAAEHSPILMVVSPEKRCGKTTLLAIIESLTYKVAPITNLTTANFYRSIDDGYVTLSLDEADTYLKRNMELIGLINKGHTKRNARTMRRDKENGMIGVWYSLWGARVIASIGKLWHTIADRSVRIALRRAKREEIPDRLRPMHDAQFAVLTRKIVRWTQDTIESLRAADPELPEELNTREADNWRILTAIADVAGGEWPMLARQVAVDLRVPESDIESPGMELLADLREALKDWKNPYLPTAELLNRLYAYDVYWLRYDYGKPLTEKALSTLLGEYEVRPTRRRVQIKGEKNKAPRGYFMAAFQHAFNTYLPPDDPEHPEHVEQLDVPPVPDAPGVPGSDDVQIKPDDASGPAQ
jgi:putative DNA primase/helicase